MNPDTESLLAMKAIQWIARAVCILILTLGGCTMASDAGNRWVEHDKMAGCYNAGGMWQWTITTTKGDTGAFSCMPRPNKGVP